ncbi:MAG: single-stranded DNA-binding protein [Bacilli bacterium]
MNKVVLVGRLTRDPELKTTSSATAVCNFSVGINRKMKNKDGNYDADFPNVVAYGALATFVTKYFTKGNLIGIEGRIQTRSYDGNDGTKRYVTEVIAEGLEFVGSNRGTNGNSDENESGFTPSFNESHEVSAPSTPSTSAEDPFKDFGSEVALSDDDLPF